MLAGLLPLTNNELAKMLLENSHTQFTLPLNLSLKPRETVNIGIIRVIG